jgi:hypothetical protein
LTLDGEPKLAIALLSNYFDELPFLFGNIVHCVPPSLCRRQPQQHPSRIESSATG